MPNTVFECATPNCANAIATEGLNRVKLEALRRWAKTCDRCGKRTQWQEKVLLLNTKTIKQPMEGKNDATSTSKVYTKSQSQKRRSAGYSGH